MIQMKLIAGPRETIVELDASMRGRVKEMPVPPAMASKLVGSGLVVVDEGRRALP